ncbi:HNH endonuclease family protein [Alteromonas lipolytica]|uniref:GmrSD restriction endonucleases C-terminal domain-containing protein n=1 Tax=Alteromonas lipolytica TaxID=1856405 RepID=A0A1E8F8F0_9ALTE|nr:HNH endonuclease family protein [Alteromonas lipolytica]OFI32192.1 hypothetical protein BFC17_08195 [Alteromonas lipolytica]GGF83123.1 hypothetical protein GCM10011338_39280 [Alteromonas lipolytica]
MRKFFVLFLLFSLPLANPLAAEIIKQSASGLCHDSRSQWYERTTRFTAYSSMKNCLAAGGKAYSGYASSASVQTPDGYSRNLFPHWLDEDGNCRDTRAETLIRQSATPVVFDDARHCRVTTGQWYDPYTGNTYTDDNDLDIDHIVPLKWAFEHGADKWPEITRAAFANDIINVIAVSLTANRSKGAKGPTEWMPSNQGYRCTYLERFQVVTRKYQLAFTATERRVLNKQLSACGLPG